MCLHVLHYRCDGYTYQRFTQTMSLQSIATGVICCIGGLVLLVLLPALLPLVVQLIYLSVHVIDGLVSCEPCCILGCLAVLLLCIGLVVVGAMVFQDACSGGSPPFFCDLIG
jgi:hypothetical protein